MKQTFQRITVVSLLALAACVTPALAEGGGPAPEGGGPAPTIMNPKPPEGGGPAPPSGHLSTLSSLAAQ